MNREEYNNILDFVFAEEMERNREHDHYLNDPQRNALADDKPWLLQKEEVPNPLDLKSLIEASGYSVEEVLEVAGLDPDDEENESAREEMVDEIRQNWM